MEKLLTLKRSAKITVLVENQHPQKKKSKITVTSKLYRYKKQGLKEKRFSEWRLPL